MRHGPGGYLVSSSGCIKEMNIFSSRSNTFANFSGEGAEITKFSAEELIELHKKTGFKIYDVWAIKKGELFLIAQSKPRYQWLLFEVKI